MAYAECCGRYHRGTLAPTAEALMRSRYTAFVVGDATYLHETWAAETRPAVIGVDDNGEPFTRLVILDKEAGGIFDTEGVVEFAAHHPAGVQRERSRFERRDGRWVYVDGELISALG